MVLEIIRIPSGPFSTNTYLVSSVDDEEAFVIDPAPGCAAAVFASLKRIDKNLAAVWITHSHFDHTAGYGDLCQHGEIPLFVHELDVENLIHPGSDGIPSCVPLKEIYPSRRFREGEILEGAAYEWLVLHTPGHSMGSSCFYCEKEGILFSGDTLFKGTYGNTSFPKSSPELMKESLCRLVKLPSETEIYPGHGVKTILSEELCWMRQAIEREFV